MGEAQEPHPTGPKPEAETTKKSPYRHYKWWLQMIIYSFLLLAGQAGGTLLGRVYFENGGESEWMATLVQVVGFPLLFPFQMLTNNKDEHSTPQKEPSPYILGSIYIGIGLFNAIDCMLYSIGIQYLPVTTYTLICASQLGFNAVFSYFLNKQNFTPYIVNSLVLLTLSSLLLVFQSDSSGDNSSQTSKKKFIIGFTCTLAASAGYALMLSLTQLAFQKIIKKETIRAVIDMTIYNYLVATFAILIGLFASGDWEKLNTEMNEFKSGKVSYGMNLFWTSVCWQAFGVGGIGLIFMVSSLFSNVISVLGLPLAPVLAVMFLGEKMTGLKAVSMLLAIWGFVSYIYQHYLDDMKMKEGMDSGDGKEHVSEIDLVNGRV